MFAWKGETLEEYWWAAEQMLTWPNDPATACCSPQLPNGSPEWPKLTKCLTMVQT